jgi:hypothetical protein
MATCLRGHIAALALIGISQWWKAILLSHSFSWLNDYIYLKRASHSGLTWKYAPRLRDRLASGQDFAR